MHIVLVHPKIPPNTGNIIRLAANIGFQLHLIKPLGFQLDDKRMQRAGLDYHEYAAIKLHNNFEEFLVAVKPKRVLAIETCGTRLYHQFAFEKGDAILFGSETRGLPNSILEQLKAEHILKIPMRENNRSINLSNSVAIVSYEAWRQLGFRPLEYL